jgi:hypothetical protein
MSCLPSFCAAPYSMLHRSDRTDAKPRSIFIIKPGFHPVSSEISQAEIADRREAVKQTAPKNTLLFDDEKFTFINTVYEHVHAFKKHSRHRERSSVRSAAGVTSKAPMLVLPLVQHPPGIWRFLTPSSSGSPCLQGLHRAADMQDHPGIPRPKSPFYSG